MSSHFIFCHKGDVLPVMRDGIEETVAGGWRGKYLGTKFAADLPASVRPYLIANVIEHLVPGQFAPDAFGIKKCYLAIFTTSQFAVAVVPEYISAGRHQTKARANRRVTTFFIMGML